MKPLATNPNISKPSTSRGFTIIEVMIVLAIAGLILLIVFLAVPSLQRNQRNTARKKDVSRIGAVVVEQITSTANVNAGLSSSDDTKIIALAGTLSQYNLTTGGSGNFSVYTDTTTPPSPTSISNVSNMRVDYGYKCDTSGGTVSVGSKKQVSIQYATEKPDGTGTPLCLDY